jgi:hypothetical protein
MVGGEDKKKVGREREEEKGMKRRRKSEKGGEEKRPQERKRKRIGFSVVCTGIRQLRQYYYPLSIQCHLFTWRGSCVCRSHLPGANQLFPPFIWQFNNPLISILLPNLTCHSSLE